MFMMSPVSARILIRHSRVTVRPFWAMGGVIVNFSMSKVSANRKIEYN